MRQKAGLGLGLGTSGVVDIYVGHEFVRVVREDRKKDG